jgi:hypothetical protein
MPPKDTNALVGFAESNLKAGQLHCQSFKFKRSSDHRMVEATASEGLVLVVISSSANAENYASYYPS